MTFSFSWECSMNPQIQKSNIIDHRRNPIEAQECDSPPSYHEKTRKCPSGHRSIIVGISGRLLHIHVDVQVPRPWTRLSPVKLFLFVLFERQVRTDEHTVLY